MNTTPIPDIVAASVCYLARWRKAPASAKAALERVETFWHPDRCRFCDTSLDELLAVCREPRDAGAIRVFQSLPPNARVARVREAQQPPWWEEFTAPPLTEEASAS